MERNFSSWSGKKYFGFLRFTGKQQSASAWKSVLSSVLHPPVSLGAGKNILDFEDFLVSNNLLPLGSLIYLLFCTSRYGWGWKKFTEEANSGQGKNILDFEDFLVSNNLLPLGSLIYLLFCTSRYGWGWKKFTEEANSGQGIRFPKWARVYVSYILPLIVLFIFVQGYITMF